MRYADSIALMTAARWRLGMEHGFFVVYDANGKTQYGGEDRRELVRRACADIAGASKCDTSSS